MAEIITVPENATVEDLLAELHTCSRYPQSAQRTRSVDVLLDLLNEWAGL